MLSVFHESGQRRNYEDEKTEWSSLSVLAAMSSSQQQRQIDTLFDVPSVFVGLPDSVSYPGCGECVKAWHEAPSCDCNGQRIRFWKAVLSLRDSTAQIQATIFESF